MNLFLGDSKPIVSPLYSPV